MEAPSDDAAERDAVGDGKPNLLDAAAGFEGHEEGLDVPRRTYQPSLWIASAWVATSRLRTHNQKMTVAAMQMALMKVWAQRSYRVAMRRQSLRLPNMRSIRLRCL